MNTPARLLLVGLVASAATATAQPKKPTPAPPPAATPKQVNTVEGINEYVLGNGLRVLLFPDTTKETFTINITYLVGSRHEGYGETGMAHLLEHMLFKGSPKHPKVWEELKQRGAANNASTWYDRTNYFETLPSKDDNLAWAIELEADRMMNANIAQTELSKEFSVVRNEFEIGENDPSGVLGERIWSTAFLWHNYGKSTIGSRADIEKVPAPTLKRFYKKYYRPDNAVLLIAGKFESQKALAMIQQHFGVVQNPATPLEQTYTQEPVQDGERIVTLRRPGGVQVVGLLYHAVAAGDPDYPAMAALSQILTDEPSGRLYTALVKTGMATSVSASILPLHDPGALEISAVVPTGKSVEAVRDKMIQIVEGLAKSKITDEEVNRFKVRSKKQLKLALANSAQAGIMLSEFIAAGDWRLLFINRDRAEKLAAADVQKAAAAHLVSSNRTLGMFYPTKTPERAPEKATPDIAKTVAGYKGKPPESEGEKFEATLENIEKRTTRATFPSGMKLAVLGKQTRGKVVRARLTLRYGSEADFTNQALAAASIDGVISRGTKKHTYQQLQDQWDALEAQVGFNSTPGQLAVSIQTTRDNFPAVLALVDEVLRQPSFPQDQFDIMVKETLASLEEAKTDPQSQAFLAAQRLIQVYPKNHPLYIPTTDETIAGMKALKLNDLRKWPAMFGTSNATLVILGDADMTTVKPWIEKTWGNWKSPRPYKRIEKKYTATTAADHVLDFADKANALIGVAHALDIKDDDPDAVPLNAANYILGGGGFVSRLTTRLRQQDGMSYFAFSGVQLDPYDPASVFFAIAAVNPENVKKGQSAMLEEITKLVSAGISAADLDGAKKGILQGFERNLSNDNAILGMLSDSLHLGRTMEFWIKNNATLKTLTADQVNQTIKRRFKPTSLVKIVAGDKKKMGI